MWLKQISQPEWDPAMRGRVIGVMVRATPLSLQGGSNNSSHPNCGDWLGSDNGALDKFN